jgi:hypothetical protein
MGVSDLKGHVGIQYLRNSMRSTRNMRAEAKRRGDTKDVKRYTKELDSLSKSFLSEVNRVKGRKKGKV